MFNPSKWSEALSEFRTIQRKYGIKLKAVSWILDHWRYPFTNHPLAIYLSKQYPNSM